MPPAPSIRSASGRGRLSRQYEAWTTSEAPFEVDHCGEWDCPHSLGLAVAHLNLKLSRLNWSTDRQPISFMSRSISARRFSSALSTPA